MVDSGSINNIPGVSVKRIDESVRRILTLEFELGLFDHPFVDPSAADAALEANRDLTRKAADESITLLRNQKQRPAAAGGGEAGRHWAERRLDDEPARRMERQLAGRLRGVCCMGPPDQIPPGTTVLKGLQDADPKQRVRVLRRAEAERPPGDDDDDHRLARRLERADRRLLVARERRARVVAEPLGVRALADGHNHR
jgi:beta-glucosidase-like glycosyl hydrolase